MRLLRTAGLIALLAGCTEPQDRSYFEGTITSSSTVIDVFQNTRTTHLRVDKTPAPSEVNSCSDQADVTVTAETFIAWESTPNKRESDDVLTPGRVVRVTPPSDPRDVCPMMIDATAIILVK